MSFGKTIAEARKKLMMSQKELAEKIKKEDGAPISPQYLNDIERDRRSPGSEHMIEQFAKVLGLDRYQLLFSAGRVPEDVRSGRVSEEKLASAYRAFRKTLKGQK
jgi:transcriptional regulator with XRE-family HTH domain